MHRRPARCLALLLAAALLALGPTACISAWRDLPRDPPPPAAKVPATLYYDMAVGETGLFGGGPALRETFLQISPFAHTEAREEAPARGLFCRIDYQRRSPSAASGVAAYISYVFLFAIPFWGTEGYLIRYHLYRDAKEAKIFEYEIKRTSFFWIVALPFTWVNFLTPSEGDAFSSTAHRFFHDAQPIFVAAAGHRA
jgi:hypothetical protein